MTAPLDEARLRELADELRVSWSDRGWVAAKKISGLLAEAREAATGIDTLLDALSAERERADRAVGLLREAETACSWSEKALERYDNALGLDVDEAALIAWSKCGNVIRESRAFLATQKAEGATDAS